MILRVFLTAGIIFGATVARAEFPALEGALREPVAKLASELEAQPTLVAVRDQTGYQWPWRLSAAIQAELTTLLAAKGLAATDANGTEGFDWLTESPQTFSALDAKRWKSQTQFPQLLLATMHLQRQALLVRFSRFDPQRRQPESLGQATLTPPVVKAANNTPALNQKVVEFVRQSLGKPIGNGECWTAAAQALAAAGAKRNGVYDFGRKLGSREALLPGDILQLENAVFQSPSNRTTMPHHTAIVDEVVGRDSLRILHQNFGKPGRTISSWTLHLKELRAGTLEAFRPTGAAVPSSVGD